VILTKYPSQLSLDIHPYMFTVLHFRESKV